MAESRKTLNESALYQIDMAINAYSDIIEGIFAVKGMGQQMNSIAWKMNLNVEGKDYANKLRSLIMNLLHASQLLGFEELDKIIFKIEKRYLILRRIVKSKGKAPLFMSIITTEKNVDIPTVEMIVDELADELQFLL